MDFSIKSNSAVWKYFLRAEKGQTAMCKLPDFKTILKICDRSAKGLHIRIQLLF